MDKKYFNVEKYLDERDSIQLKNNLFDELEINISRECNRACNICPHSKTDYKEFLKFQNKFMDVEIFNIIFDNLRTMEHHFNIDLIGMGEPTLHPNFLDFVTKLASLNKHLRVTTNGDNFLNNPSFLFDFINIIKNKNVTTYISVYEKSSYKKFFGLANEIEKIFGYRIELKDMFLNSDNLKSKFINNRGGAMYKECIALNTCNYPFYSLYIDTNGDIQYCPHDWYKKLVFANIRDKKLIDAWNKKTEHRKMMLRNERQKIDPCKYCNVDGCRIGNSKRKFFDL